MQKSTTKTVESSNDVFTQKINKFTCAIHNHDKIVQICIQPQCKKSRLCCVQCVDEYHLEHKLVSIKKFSSLYCKYGINEQGIEELQKIVASIKDEFHKKVDQFFKCVSELIDYKMSHIQENTQDEQKLFVRLNLVAQSNLWSFLIDSQKQKVQLGTIQKKVAQKFNQLKELVFTQLSAQCHTFNHAISEMYNRMVQTTKHWNFGTKQKPQERINQNQTNLHQKSEQHKSLHQQEKLWKQKARIKKAYIDDLMD